MERGGHNTLQKIQVTCRTCGVTESFYSNLSVDHFKLSHRGHDVVVSGEKPRAAVQPPKVVEKSPEPVQEVAPAIEAPPKVEPRQEEEGVTRVAKVVVDTVMFPALSNPVLRIRGFTADLELAFVVSSSPGNAAKIRDVLARGEYLDEGSTGIRYVWDAEVIEFEEGTRERLGLPAETKKTEPVVAPAPPKEMEEDTVAKTNEMLFGPARIEEPEQVFPEVAPALAPIEEPQAEQVETAAAPPPPETREERAVERKLEAPPARRAQPPKRAKKKAQPALEEPKPRGPEEKEEFLLVSKSWYVQGGNQSREEAVRISKVLKEFRWKVEPVYTIGVMLDDILSIETSKTEITRALIERIEESGYRLTAVVAEQGKPVAWFKRTPEQPQPREVRSTKRRAAGADETVAEEEAKLARAGSGAAPAETKETAPEETGSFGILDLTRPVPEEGEPSTDSSQQPRA